MSALYRVDFEVANNEDFRYAFTLSNDSGGAVDLTGASFRMDVETSAGAEVLSLSTTNGRVVVAPLNGRLDLIVPAQDMGALLSSVCQHDMIMNQGGATTRLWSGTFSIIQGITE